jgi:hypothetical protein
VGACSIADSDLALGSRSLDFHKTVQQPQAKFHVAKWGVFCHSAGLQSRPTRFTQVYSVKAHGVLEQLLDTALPTSGRLFPHLTVDKVVKRYAHLRRLHPELHGTVFHSTRKWFITQCERTGVPEHFTATLVRHHSARSANKLTYGLYSAGISDAQKRVIVEWVRLPQDVLL